MAKILKFVKPVCRVCVGTKKIIVDAGLAAAHWVTCPYCKEK